MVSSNRQNMLPTLFLVGTPIGNLGDLSPRVKEILSSVEILLCEDTRRTRELLNHLEIKAPQLIRFDSRAEIAAQARQFSEVFAALDSGRKIAFVSDAGMPAISDPAARLVRAAHAHGYRVEAIAGPSAVAVFASLAGFLAKGFSFRGFFPREKKSIEAELKQIAEAPPEQPSAFIWFESPKRVHETLIQIVQAFPEAYLVVAKELTKLYEKIFAGSSSQVLERVRSELDTQGEIGEWVIGLEIIAPAKNLTENEESSWIKTLQCLLENDVAISAAVKTVSQSFGIPRNRAYSSALEISGKSQNKSK